MRRFGRDELGDAVDISIHAPVKGATLNALAFMSQADNFNPRTREGCDCWFAILLGAGLRISIHAPVKGATDFPVRRPVCHGYFNPRTREGCDAKSSTGHFLVPGISIHAPVKGATAWDAGNGGNGNIFQSTHP